MIKRYSKSQKGEKLSAHFTVADVWSNSRYDYILHDELLTEALEAFRAHFKQQPRLRTYKGNVVTSAGYRNSAIDWKGSKTSRHCSGMGLDIEIPGVPAYKLAQFAETLPYIGGIGHYWRTYTHDALACEHIHIDTRSRSNPARWGYQGKTSGCNIPTFGGVYKPLKRGHVGVAVYLVQAKLKELGYSVSPDGNFGAKTQATLRKWQFDNGLKQDGVYGRDCDKKMDVFGW